MKEFYIKIVITVPDKFPEEPETAGFWDEVADAVIDTYVTKFKGRDLTLDDTEIELHTHYHDQPRDESEAERKARLGR